ncbi:MAG TPA: CoA-transferase [Smithellaceae bacterium]|nr:CoA-transferase [Smithellaceae bacterium]HPE07439.1 CoA-transferase [Smithellaceae bacterium]HRY37725.1 CoA-transferase [Smithellaceae bacterium]
MAKYLYNEEAVANLKLSDTSVLDRLVDFESARAAHLKKEHGKKDKRMTMGEAVATFVQDGDIITDGGFSYVRTPHQAFHEVIRQGKKNLQMIGAPNTNQSFFITYGLLAHSHSSYTGAEMRGIDRVYDRGLKAGKFKIIAEWSHGGVAQGFKAAQLGTPGFFSKQMLGSDLVRYNPYLKVMQHPLKKEKDPVVFVPALYPDVAFIHCNAADKYGNAYIYGPAVNDLAVAAAARKLIITAEEIVPENDIRYNKQGQIIPFFYADAVVEMPFGALPGSMPGCYYWPRQWWEKCMRFGGASEENNKAFCDEWIMGVKNQFEFVEKLGGAKWIAEARRQTKAAEGDNEDIDFSYEEYTLKHDSGLYY